MKHGGEGTAWNAASINDLDLDEICSSVIHACMMQLRITCRLMNGSLPLCIVEAALSTPSCLDLRCQGPNRSWYIQTTAATVAHMNQPTHGQYLFLLGHFGKLTVQNPTM